MVVLLGSKKEGDEKIEEELKTAEDQSALEDGPIAHSCPLK